MVTSDGKLYGAVTDPDKRRPTLIGYIALLLWGVKAKIF